MEQIKAKTKLELMEYRLNICIKAFEKVSGYTYFKDEPYYTFIWEGSYHNITFIGNEIHTGKNDICLSKELRKKLGWHHTQDSRGTHLIYLKWLKPMHYLMDAIKDYENAKEEFWINHKLK